MALTYKGESTVGAVTTLSDADKIRTIVGNASKYITWANLKALLKALTDTYYQAKNAGLTTLSSPSAWRLFYSNGSSAIIELVLGADGTYLKSNGAAAAPTFDTPAGGGGGFSLAGYIDCAGDATNFPAATAGEWYQILNETSPETNPAGWLGGAAGAGVWVNLNDLLMCVATTDAGTYAEVGDNWTIVPQVISLPDGWRKITLADNTAIEVVAGEHGIGVQGGKFLKEEAGVLYPLDGNAYETIWIPAAAFTPAVSDGPAPSGECLAFDAVTVETADHYFPMPEDWNLGTVKAKHRWKPATDSGAPGETVEWKLALTAIRDGDAIATALGTAVIVTDAVLANESATHHFSNASAAITPGGTPAVGCWLHVQLSRNAGATDTHAYDALYEGLELQYLKTKSIVLW